MEIPQYNFGVGHMKGLPVPVFRPVIHPITRQKPPTDRPVLAATPDGDMMIGLVFERGDQGFFCKEGNEHLCCVTHYMELADLYLLDELRTLLPDFSGQMVPTLTQKGVALLPFAK